MSQFQLLVVFLFFLPWICRLETANCHVIKLDNLTSSSSSIPPTPLKTGTEEVLLYKFSHRRKTAIFNIFNLTTLLLFVLHRKKKSWSKILPPRDPTPSPKKKKCQKCSYTSNLVSSITSPFRQQQVLPEACEPAQSQRRFNQDKLSLIHFSETTLWTSAVNGAEFICAVWHFLTIAQIHPTKRRLQPGQ